MDERAKKVFEYIESHQDEYISKFQEFVRQPSVAVNGYGIPKMIAMVENSFDELGAEVTKFENDGNPIIYAYLKGDSEHTIGFYDHYDVQPEGDHELWEDDPYGAVIRDGVMYGRGCADNKNGLVAKICAVDAWKKV